jgi:periplasmic protein TonB
VAEAVLTSLEERERVFRRAVGISAGAHLALLLFALVSPFPRSRSVTLPGVMNVSLVAAAPSAPSAAKPALRKPPAPPPAKPKAKPAEPKPEPPPPPKPEVKADKKLLPKDAVREPKPAPPKPKPAVAPPKPEEKLDYEDALDALREDLGEEASDAPDPELVASVRPGPKAGPPGSGPGDPVDPEVAAWMRRVKIHVTRNWVLQPGFKRQAIQAVVDVTLDATGNVLEIDVTEGSGNPYYDQSVVRAIEKASPLPPPPESGDWPILFSPQDVL